MGVDGADWIQLKSGEWLRGRLRYIQQRQVEFDSDEQLQDRLTRAGFEDVGLRPVPGWQRGMVRAVWGRRP